jgi:hypothetical protein
VEECLHQGLVGYCILMKLEKLEDELLEGVYGGHRDFLLRVEADILEIFLQNEPNMLSYFSKPRYIILK